MHSSRQFVIFRIFTSEVSMRGGLLSKVGHTMPSGVTKMQPLTFPSSVLFKNSRILRTLVNRPSPDPTPEVGVGHLSGWRRCSEDPKRWTMVMNGQVEIISQCSPNSWSGCVRSCSASLESLANSTSWVAGESHHPLVHGPICPAYTWIFIGDKFLSRADFGLISAHFL